MAFTGNDMALFIFLKQVFDFKHRVENWEKKDFHGIRFDPWINKWTRDVFINKGLFQYLKIYEDRKLFELFYRDLSFKPELRFLNNPFLLKDSNEKGLPQQAHDQIKKEAAQINPAVPAQIYGKEAKTTKEERRPPKSAVIQTKEKKEEAEGKEEEKAAEIEEAAETMASAEEGVSKEAAQQPEPGHRMPAGLPPMPTFTAPAKTTQTSQSKPAAVGKSSKAVEEHAAQGVPSTKAGLPVDDVSGESTQPAKGMRPKGTGFQFPKAPAGFVNAMKNFGSAAGRFFQRNMGKFFTVGRIGMAVSAGIGAVAGAGFGPIGSLAGAAGGGIGSFWIKSGDGAKFLGKALSRGGNAFDRLLRPGSKGTPGSFGSFGSKKLVWGLFLGLFFFVFFSGLIGGITNTTPSGQAAPQAPPFIGTLAPPPSADYQKLHADILDKFKINFDKAFPYDYLKWAWEILWSISGTDFLKLLNPQSNAITVNSIADSSSLNEQTGKDSIGMRINSRSNGKPYPETLFKIIFIHELSHIIEQYNPNNSKNELQQIISQEEYLTNYSQNANTCAGSNKLNEDYAETLAYYLNPNVLEQSLNIGAECEPTQPARVPFASKPLHYQFATKLLGVTGLPSPLTSLPKFSCPVAGGGEEWYGSFQADPVDGHCGSNYNKKLKASDPDYVACSGDTRRGKSMDRKTGGANGNDIILPEVNNKTVEWQFTNQFDLSAKDCFAEEIINPNGLNGGCGRGYVFQSPPVAKQTNGQNWVLHLLHMGPTNLQLNQIYNSGEVVGKTEAIHAHISIGIDIRDVYSQDEASWKSVDTEMKLCQ